MGKKQKKSGEDAKDDIDALAAEIEGAGASKEPKGKKKKKAGKKDDFEDDIMKELEELSLESTGGKGKQAPPPTPASESDDDSSSQSRMKAKGGKKGGKTSSVSDEEEDQDKGMRKGEEGGSVGGKDDSEDDEEFTSRRDKKKKKGKPLKAESEDEEEQQEDNGTFKIKTAAQKKAEKKERERKKKEEERMKQKKQKEKEEPEGDKKKKDKKKKKGEKDKDEDKKKKGPSKATVKAMQEALAKMKERLEQERKEKKKQKAKERKERLKKEGKLLTKAQKEAQARAETMLMLLQAQVDVPSRDKEVQKKKPVYRDKRRKKPATQTPETSEVTSPTSETPEPVAMETEAEAPPAEPVKPEAAVDNWEAIASDEEKELKKVHIEVKEDIAAPPQPAASEDEEEEEEEDEDDDDEEEDEDDEDSEEEAEVEKPTVASQGKRRAPSEDESSESEDDDGRTKEERLYDRAKRRIEKRRVENMKNIDLETLRAPVVCVLGHVDTGKTKILDKLRHTHVQDGEAGGITQQIGATNVPKETIEEQTKMAKNFNKESIKIPGMLIIDTPGHESFNLRNRGSSLCDIAILVVDIMHGLEPQTLESINLLKEKKCPFIVALNKIDRLYDWKKSPETDVVATLKKQKKNTKDEFDERAKAIIVEFAQQGLNAALFYENKDPRTFVSLVPTSAHDGMGNLIALLVELTQTMLARRLAHCDELRAQVMEVKALPGMGTTIDVILINGRLREGETIIVPGVEGPIVTQIRGLLLPPPLKELRNQYEKHKEVSTAQGVKILGKDLEKTLAGLPLLVAHKDDEIPVLRDELVRELKQTLSSIKLEEKGVYVQASTLGSLEALLEFLRTSKVPYAGINIGPVHKKDVMKASTMLEHDPYAVILAFDVKVERESQEMADSLGVRIFSAEIIYHLFDAFTKYREDYKKAKQDEFHVAVFPVKLRVLPQFIFNSRDPIVMGVTVEAGVLKQGTPLCVPSKAFVDIGVVTSIEINHKPVDTAKKGQEICIKIEPIPGESPKMYGRHFEATDIIVSKITRASIDALKNWFRDEMQKSDWQLIMELKKTFEII
uniref:Eukaryotic translation initiation factor 5B n=1 Tax=Neolamprologus brichardi TaxID=32507 RepID=A0A3Q4HXR5_NEOBR